MKPLVCVLVSATTFLSCLSTACGQTGEIQGRVETPDGQSIASVSLTLKSSLGETRYQVSAKSESDGTFRIPISWDDINAANRAGSTWSITAEKEDYSSNHANVLLVDGRIEPDLLLIKMTSNPYEKYFSLIDGCPRSPAGEITLYIFDLKAVLISPQTAGTIPGWLADKLDSGIRAHLESYKLLGDLRIQVRICSSFPVNTAEAAIVFGQRLRSPAVLWGDVVGSPGDRLTARLKFTLLLDKPITDIASIRYNSIDSLYEPRASVDKSYLALASLILGKMHLQKQNTSYALKCFYHARELNALPPGLSGNLASELARLEQTNVARGLTPVGGGSR